MKGIFSPGVPIDDDDPAFRDLINNLSSNSGETAGGDDDCNDDDNDNIEVTSSSGSGINDNIYLEDRYLMESIQA